MSFPWRVAVAVAITVFSARAQDLRLQYDKLKIHTALLAPSSAVDEMPLWSPDSKTLAVNIEGRWYGVEFGKVYLISAARHKNTKRRSPHAMPFLRSMKRAWN